MKKVSKTKGAASVMIVLGIVAILALLLAGGLNPKTKHKDTEPKSQGELIQDTPSDEQKSLQLRNLKFIKISPTITQLECSDKVAVDLLVDTSGSMNFGTKLSKLQNALHRFLDLLPDDSLIAIQDFNEQAKEDLSFSTLSEVKSNINTSINGIIPAGSTHTKDGFELAKQKILEAKNKYPDYKFSLVFFTDGVPETEQLNRNPLLCQDYRCGINTIFGRGPRCFDHSQDPTENPNIAQEIKDAGVQIFSIFLKSDEDSCFFDDQDRLMKNASSTNDYYSTQLAADLNDIYERIANKICE